MSHPAKKAFFGSFVALCLLGSAWGQSTISLTNSATATSTGGNYVNLSLGKFNSDLGELSSVVVTINFVTFSGSVQLENPGESAVTITNILSLAQFTNNTLGFGPTRTLTATNTFNPGFPVVIEGFDAATFALSPDPATNNFNFSTNIPTNFWAAYSSAGGSGSNIFQFRARLNPQQESGSSPIPNYSAFSGTAQMSVTYTYSTGPEPIPEPSTVAAGAFLTVLAAASYWRRRRSAR